MAPLEYTHRGPCVKTSLTNGNACATVGLMATLAHVLKTTNYSEIARRTGMTPGYISLLFRGKRGGTLETLGRLSKVLGVEVGELHDHLTRISRQSRKRTTTPAAA